MNPDLCDLIAAKRDFGEQVCKQIAVQIDKLAFAETERPLDPQFDAAQFQRVVDPYSQSQDLVGTWRDVSNQLLGQIKFHGDGSFYAEFDVIRQHPRKKHVFVEAIHAWGNETMIKAEPRLLAMPND